MLSGVGCTTFHLQVSVPVPACQVQTHTMRKLTYQLMRQTHWPLVHLDGRLL